MKEQTRHRLAYNAYIELGGGRSLPTLQAALVANPTLIGLTKAPELRTLYEWSRQLHWQERLAETEAEVRRTDAAAQVDALREMNVRQARLGVALQEQGLRRLLALAEVGVDPATALRMVQGGTQIERQSRGAASQAAGDSHPLELANLEGFSDAELRALLDALPPDSDDPGRAQPPESA